MAKDDLKDIFYEELDLVFEKISQKDVKILFSDFNAKIGREDCFTIGKHSKHRV